jgi:hypothetical protein
MSKPPSRVERFLAHLDQVSGGVEPQFFPVESTHAGLKGLTAIVYRDTPEPGLLTGLTYGLSLSDHPEWRLGKPELIVSVRSAEVIWAQAVAFIAEQLRGACPFTYGTTLNFGERISTDSEMTAFVIFAPAVLERAGFLGIDVGDCKINLAGCYPIYESERTFIGKHGLEIFWKREWDPYDVRRAPSV